MKENKITTATFPLCKLICEQEIDWPNRIFEVPFCNGMATMYSPYGAVSVLYNGYEAREIVWMEATGRDYGGEASIYIPSHTGKANRLLHFLKTFGLLPDEK